MDSPPRPPSRIDAAEHTEDKRAILARRAALVAGVLATVGVAPRAEAQPGEIAAPCPPRREPTSAELDEARRLVDEAGKLSGDVVASIDRLRRAYALAPRPGLAALLMEALEQADQLDAAHDAGVTELACGGAHPELQERVIALENRTGLVRVFAGASATEILVDGRSVETAAARRGLRLRPGRHRFQLAPIEAIPNVREIEVVAGQIVTVEFPTERPQPCLSVHPEPCLSIMRPEDDETKYAVHIGFIAPAVTIGTAGGSPYPVGGGGGVRLALAARVAGDLWFDGDLFSVIAYGDGRRVDTAGTVAELRYHAFGVYGFGAGFSGGITEVFFDGADEPMRAGIFGPVAVPASLLFPDALLELRVPFWFGATIEGRPDHELGLFQITPHLVVSWGIRDKILGRAF